MEELVVLERDVFLIFFANLNYTRKTQLLKLTERQTQQMRVDTGSSFIVRAHTSFEGLSRRGV